MRVLDVDIACFVYVCTFVLCVCVQVVPGKTSLLQTSLDISGLSNVLAGVTSTFTILARDAFSNSVLGGDDIKVR